MTGFYVYAYLREDGTPYYVGKGAGNRAWTKGKDEIKKPTNKTRIIIIAENLTNDEAKYLEIELISHLGRKDLGTGVLRNKTPGGDGAILFGPQNGMFGRTREKHHHFGKHRPDVAGANNAMYGKKGTDHPAAGYKHTESARIKIAESKRGVKRVGFDQSGNKNPMFGRTGEKNLNFGKSPPKTECPHCGNHISNSMFVRWHKNNKCKKKGNDQ